VYLVLRIADRQRTNLAEVALQIVGCWGDTRPMPALFLTILIDSPEVPTG
jgi:hypothetical protein